MRGDRCIENRELLWRNTRTEIHDGQRPATRPGNQTSATAREVLRISYSARTLRSLLGAAWEYALDAGRLPETAPNWRRQVMKGRLKSKGKRKRLGGEHVGQQRRVLQNVELQQLLAWLPNLHELGRDTTEMCLHTCARGAEIPAMRSEHISEEADGW